MAKKTKQTGNTPQRPRGEKRLAVKREVLRNLQPGELGQVAGGLMAGCRTTIPWPK